MAEEIPVNFLSQAELQSETFGGTPVPEGNIVFLGVDRPLYTEVEFVPGKTLGERTLGEYNFFNQSFSDFLMGDGDDKPGVLTTEEIVDYYGRNNGRLPGADIPIEIPRNYIHIADNLGPEGELSVFNHESTHQRQYWANRPDAVRRDTFAGLIPELSPGGEVNAPLDRNETTSARLAIQFNFQNPPEAGRVLANRGTIDDQQSRGLINRLDYLSRGVEIQARIAQIVLDHYDTTKALPANREELLILMKNSGVTLPEETIRALEQLPNYEQLNQKFSIDSANFNPYTKGAARDINLVLEQYDPPVHPEFFDKVASPMYVDLLEGLGAVGVREPDGSITDIRQKFGYGESPYFNERLSVEIESRGEEAARVVRPTNGSPLPAENNSIPGLIEEAGEAAARPENRSRPSANSPGSPDSMTDGNSSTSSNTNNSQDDHAYG